MIKASSTATVLFALLRILSSSDACKCVEPGSFQLEDYQSAGRIFECQVVGMSVSGEHENTVECEVPIVYKGNATDEEVAPIFSLTTSSSTASCGFPFELRGIYLVYQDVSGIVHSCGRTSWLESDDPWVNTSQAEQDIIELMELGARNTSACGGELPSVEDAFEDAARVFECSVVGVASSVSTENLIPHVSATCAVKKLYKGESTKDETSLGEGTFITEGFSFSPGGDYLVYQNQDGTVSTCSRTAPLSSQQAQQDIVTLGTLAGEERKRALFGLRNFHS